MSMCCSVPARWILQPRKFLPRSQSRRDSLTSSATRSPGSPSTISRAPFLELLPLRFAADDGCALRLDGEPGAVPTHWPQSQLTAGPAYFDDFVLDVVVIPAQKTRDLLDREGARACRPARPAPHPTIPSSRPAVRRPRRPPADRGSRCRSGARPSDTRPLQPQLQAGQASTRDVLKCGL